MILHICSKTDWEKALLQGSYKDDSLSSEGFIHCSTPEQVLEVADYIFRARPGLIVLIIDPEKVAHEIRYEDAGNGKLYPHVYGPLNLEAVTATIDFPPKSDGTFALPEFP